MVLTQWKALEQANPNRVDHILILGDATKKAQSQVHYIVYSLAKENMLEEKAQELAKVLSDGRWTYDYPNQVQTGKRARTAGE